MKLQSICEQYAAFRKALGERFEVNGRQLKAFCRAMGQNIDITNVSSEKVNTFLVGKGPLTTSWYVRHNALLGFYRYAISRGFVATSALPLVIPKLSPTFQPYIYSSVELLRILDSTESCRRPRSDLDAAVFVGSSASESDGCQRFLALMQLLFNGSAHGLELIAEQDGFRDFTHRFAALPAFPLHHAICFALI